MDNVDAAIVHHIDTPVSGHRTTLLKQKQERYGKSHSGGTKGKPRPPSDQLTLMHWGCGFLTDSQIFGKEYPRQIPATIAEIQKIMTVEPSLRSFIRENM